MRKCVWVREDSQHRPVKTALTRRGAGEPTPYGHRPVAYVSSEVVDEAHEALVNGDAAKCKQLLSVLLQSITR